MKIFDNYSNSEILSIYDYPLDDERCIIRIKNTDKETLLRVPLLRQAMALIDILKEQKEIKLTCKGFLPTTYVKELHQLGAWDQEIERGISKLHNEQSSLSVNTLHYLLSHIGVIKKRQGKLSLTANGIKAADDSRFLLKEMVLGFTKDYNWEADHLYHRDLYEIGNLHHHTLLFLFLMLKYGKDFEANSVNYARALCVILNIDIPEKELLSCINCRIFDRLFYLFGFVNGNNMLLTNSYQVLDLTYDIFELKEGSGR